MSVKQEFSPGACLATTAAYSTSQFTFKDLRDLNDPLLSYLLPLSVISLIDLNAFFAQVEQLRLGLPVETPVVCVQWLTLIAVSYAARKFGIGRLDTLQSAKQKCPNLVCAHAAVFKKGESHWAYTKGLPNQATHKVSLDPYRRESRKIVKIFQQHCDLVEKASVDESYLDLGRLVYKKLLSLFPLLAEGQDSDYMPSLPDTLPEELQFRGVVIKSTEEENLIQNNTIMSLSQQFPEGPPTIGDWDDVCMLIGSMIVLDIRKALYDEMGYTTSAGIASNKQVAKLAGGFKKPDNQCVIRNRLTYSFLNNFELNDVTSMGGKTGDFVLQKLRVPPDKGISYIRENFTLEAIEEEFNDDIPLAKKIYEIVRGNHRRELVNRMDVKSMMSRKNFLAKHPVETLSDADSWIKVFAGDLYNRMIELDEENLRLSMLQVSNKEKGVIKRPKTLSINLGTSSGIRRSKQAQLMQYSSLDRLWEHFEQIGYRILRDLLETITETAKLNGGRTLKELEAQSLDPRKIKVASISHLSLTISNFIKANDSSLIDSYTGNTETDKESAQAKLKQMFDEVNKSALEKQEKEPSPAPQPRIISSEDKSYIKKLFDDFQMSNHIEEASKSPKRSENKAQGSSMKTSSEKHDSKYIKKLFEDYQTQASLDLTLKSNSGIQHAKEENTKVRNAKEIPRPRLKSPAQNPPKRKLDIFQSLQKRQKPQSKSTDDFLNTLLQTMYCPQCKEEIDNAVEHNDFHVAMEISNRINGH